MHKNYRNKSDYKEGDIVYFVRVESGFAPYITLKKCIIIKIDPQSNDIKCDAIYDCITDDNLNSYKNWDIAYDWLARSYDEAIQEIVDYKKIDNKKKIEILFYQDTYRR